MASANNGSCSYSYSSDSYTYSYSYSSSDTEEIRNVEPIAAPKQETINVDGVTRPRLDQPTQKDDPGSARWKNDMVDAITAQTAAAVTAAITATLNHTKESVRASTITGNSPAQYLADASEQGTAQAPEAAADSSANNASMQASLLQNSHSSTLCAASPQPIPPGTEASAHNSARPQENDSLYPVSHADLLNRYDTLKEDFSEYKRKMQSELLLAHEKISGLERQIQVERNNTSALQKQQDELLARLSYRDDEVAKLRMQLKRGSCANQAEIGPSSPDACSSNAERSRTSSVIYPSANIIQSPGRKMSAHSPPKRENSPNRNKANEQHAGLPNTVSACKAISPPSMQHRSVDEIVDPVFNENCQGGSTSVKNVMVGNETQSAQNMPPEANKNMQHQITPIQIGTAPIMSYDDFLHKRAKEMALEELKNRQHKRNKEIDARIEKLQVIAAQLVEKKSHSELPVESINLLNVQNDRCIVPEPDPSQITSGEPDNNINHKNKTQINLSEITPAHPKYRLYKDLETEYIALSTHLDGCKEELRQFEGKAGKRTHRETVRMSFLETQISKEQADLSRVKGRLKAIEDAL